MPGYSERGAHGRTVAVLGQSIVLGRIAPGESLDVIALEEEFGVSRTVIREALRVLAAKGLVGARPRRGTYVLPRSDWALLDEDVLRWRYADRDDQGFLDQLFEVRLTVEPAVARLAAVRRDDADLVRLRAALSAMGASRDAAWHVEADVAFHRALLVSAHNELFEQMAIVVEVGLRARDQLVHSRISKSSVPEHAAVVDAVEARDAGAAEHAMRRLLLDTNLDVDAARSAGPGIDRGQRRSVADEGAGVPE